MKNLEIAAIFGNMADLLEIQGANPFRVRAYRNARSSLESLTDNIEQIARRESLSDIPGIGKDLTAKITEYIHSGKIGAFEDLKKELPIGLVEIVGIPTIGPKTARAIFDTLGVESVPDLEQRAASGELLDVPGIKKKTLENIIRGIELYKKRKGSFLLGRAFPAAGHLVDLLAPHVERIALAGSLRRMKETVHDVDILVAASKKRAPEIMKMFVELDPVAQILAHGEIKSSIRLADDLQVDLRVVPPGSWGAALVYFTGGIRTTRCSPGRCSPRCARPGPNGSGSPGDRPKTCGGSSPGTRPNSSSSAATRSRSCARSRRKADMTTPNWADLEFDAIAVDHDAGQVRVDPRAWASPEGLEILS
jgi:DNA polymerase (family 10)